MNIEKELTGYPSIDKPWLKYYSEDKRDFDIPDCTVYDYMVNQNQNNLSDVALEYFGRKITYSDLIKKIDICTEALLSLGVKKGDIVSFCNPTTPEIYYVFYALNKIGATANLIDPRTNVSRIEKFIMDTESNIVFYIDIAYPKIKDILANPKIKKAISISAADSLPLLLKLGYKLKNPSKGKPVSDDKYIDWKQFLKVGNDSTDKYVKPQNCRDLPAGIIYTSGTTGIPKGAVISNKNLIAMVMQNICADIGWDKRDRFLGIMPPFIAYGLVCGFTLPVCLGMRIIIIPKFEVEQFDSYIMKHLPNHIMGVPSYIEGLLTSQKLKDADLGFVKTVIVGGDKLNTESEVCINEYLKQHNCKSKVIKGYGLSEMSSNAVFPRNDQCNKIGSVGSPLINNNIKIIDSESGSELGYNEVGEICLTGPTLISGYWNNPEEDNKVFKIENNERWIHTGDRGYIDTDGVVFFNDRVKRINVRSDGHNVWPSEIEALIEKQQNITGCCVVGTKDKSAEHGEIVTAFIVVDTNESKSKDAVIKDLNEELLKNLPTRDVPALYYAIDKLPLSNVGKIDYRALEKMAEEMERKK